MKNAVDDKFDKLQGISWCAKFTGVSDVVSTNVDVHSMRIRFLGAQFTNYFSICDFFAPLHWDIGAMDNLKIVHTFDALVVWYTSNLDYALAQSSKFFGLWLIPKFWITGMCVSSMSPDQEGMPELWGDVG